jgi:hypothetical protein
VLYPITKDGQPSLDQRPVEFALLHDSSSHSEVRTAEGQQISEIL